MDTFADLMTSERQRINDEREALLTRHHEIEAEIHALDREMNAITAYERAKQGKVLKAHKGTNGAGTRAPRGSKREQIIAVITANPQGVSRGELLEVMQLKGDKSSEMSVSNALTAMIKNDTLMRNEEKKYVLSV